LPFRVYAEIFIPHPLPGKRHSYPGKDFLISNKEKAYRFVEDLPPLV